MPDSELSMLNAQSTMSALSETGEPWRVIMLTSEWGYEQFYECPNCSAMVTSMDKHMERCQ